jgi:hypothetical protein
LRGDVRMSEIGIGVNARFWREAVTSDALWQ